MAFPIDKKNLEVVKLLVDTGAKGTVISVVVLADIFFWTNIDVKTF